MYLCVFERDLYSPKYLHPKDYVYLRIYRLIDMRKN